MVDTSSNNAIKIAVVQIAGHPSFAIDETDYLAEPFIVEDDSPILTMLGYYNFDIKDLKKSCRQKYLYWQQMRLISILAWFASGEVTDSNDHPTKPSQIVIESFLKNLLSYDPAADKKNQDNDNTDQNADKSNHLNRGNELSRMPHIIVFPEGSIPRHSLFVLQDFAKKYKVVIFAGTHAFELGSEARIHYNELSIVNYKDFKKSGIKSLKDLKENNNPAFDEGYILSANRELARISNAHLPSIHVLPIIDSSGVIFLRVKKFLSPFEKHQSDPDSYSQDTVRPSPEPAGAGANNGAGDESPGKKRDVESPGKTPEVVEVTLRNGRQILILACVCSEALKLEFPNDPYKLLIIPSYNKTNEPFQAIISHISKNSIPVIYCNDGLYGGSEIRLPLDSRQSSWWFSSPRNGKLPTGDGILMMDIDIDHIGATVGINNPKAYYRLQKISAIIPSNTKLPEYRVTEKLNEIRSKINKQNVAKQSISPEQSKDGKQSESAEQTKSRKQSQDAENNHLISAELQEVENSLYELGERGFPTPIQRMNLEHICKLVTKPRNCYPYTWDVYANDCIIHHISEDQIGISLKLSNQGNDKSSREITGTDYWQARSLEELERELAEECFHRIVHLLDEPHDETKNYADVLFNARRRCADKFDKTFDISVLPSVTNRLKELTNQVEDEAYSRLLHNLGGLVERASATSGWIFLESDKSASSGASENSNDGLFSLISHNMPNTKQRLFLRDGIVNHVSKKKEGYYANFVKSDLGVIKDLYYRDGIPSTRADLAVPIFAYEYEGETLKKQAIGILNLESKYSGAFWPMHIGELQSAVGMLAADLLIMKSIREGTQFNVWHPQLHGWGMNRIVENFCFAVATALPSIDKEPLIGCTVWQYDEEKGLLYADGTTRFDYEYISERTLGRESFTGNVCIKQARGAVSTLGSKAWYLMERKEKAMRMELQQIKSAPIFNPRYKKPDPAAASNGLQDNRERYGALNLYLYDYQNEAHGINIANTFTDNTLVRLADNAGKLIYDSHYLRKKVAVTTLVGRLQEESLPESTIFELIKNLIMEFLRADGCSVFWKTTKRDESPANNPTEKPNGNEQPSREVLICLATSGISGYSELGAKQIKYDLKEVMYDLVKDREEIINKCEPIAKQLFKEISEKIEYGISVYIAGKTDAIVRKLNVQNIEEPVKVTQDNEECNTKYFFPYRKHPETLVPPQSGHHRLLVVSVTDKSEKDESEKNVLGIIRVVRRSSSAPFTFHDADLLKELAKASIPAFKQHLRHYSENKEFEKRQQTNSTAPDPQGPDYYERLKAESRLNRQFLGYTRWSNLYIESILNDLLFLFKNEGAILAGLRFITLNDDFSEYLKVYMLRSVWSDEPPVGIYAQPVARSRSCVGWKTIESGNMIKYDKTQCNIYKPLSTDSKYVQYGYSTPVRFFSNGHAAIGVLSVDFREQEEEEVSPERFKKKLFLAARRLTCLVHPNNKMDKYCGNKEENFEELKKEITKNGLKPKFLMIESAQSYINRVKEGVEWPTYIRERKGVLNKIEDWLSDSIRKNGRETEYNSNKKHLPGAALRSELEFYGAFLDECEGWMIFPLYCGGIFTAYAVIIMQSMRDYMERFLDEKGDTGDEKELSELFKDIRESCDKKTAYGSKIREFVLNSIAEPRKFHEKTVVLDLTGASGNDEEKNKIDKDKKMVEQWLKGNAELVHEEYFNQLSDIASELSEWWIDFANSTKRLKEDGDFDFKKVNGTEGTTQDSEKGLEKWQIIPVGFKYRNNFEF